MKGKRPGPHGNGNRSARKEANRLCPRVHHGVCLIHLRTPHVVILRRIECQNGIFPSSGHQYQGAELGAQGFR